MERLYKFIEDYMPDDYDVTYQYLDETKEKAIGIYLYAGQANSNWNDGLLCEYVKAHIEVNCGKTFNSYIDAINKIRKSVIQLENAYSNIDGLEIHNIRILNNVIGDTKFKNQHGIQKVFSNLEIQYTLEVE